MRGDTVSSNNTTAFTYVSLRWADVAVRRSVDAMMTANIWRRGAMSAPQSRCFASSGTTGADRTGQHQRRTHFQPATPLWAGLTDTDGCAGHKVAQTEGAVVRCLYPQTTATPSLFSHSPLSSLDLCSLLPIPKRVSLPKS